jgi:hypothetical protein
MKPLILTGSLLPEFVNSRIADLAIDPGLFRFVWGPPPAEDELAAYLGPMTSSMDRSRHWSGWASPWKQSVNKKHRKLGLAGFCQHCDSVELWFDGRPENQLKLVWLLDYFSQHPEAAARLKLRLVDLDMGVLARMGKWRPPLMDVTEREFAVARAAWQAWRSPTPQACLDLLRTDLSALPLLKDALIQLLRELPAASNGLGASEMRMLEMIARGYSRCNALFHLGYVRSTNVYNEMELGVLLEGLAFGPAPAIAGLDDELRTLDSDNHRARQKAFQRSELSLTTFGKDLVAHKEDFVRHNPVDRWWGGTHLANDKLWRWSPALMQL